MSQTGPQSENRTANTTRTRRVVVAVATALLVVTAGCAGTMGGATPGGTDGGADGGTDANSGTVNFYVSDQPNDMDDFEHLNVTVTSVRFHLTDAANESGDAENDTATDGGTATANATAVATDASDDETDVADNETAEADDAEEADESGDGRWITRDVNDTTVDLTQLRGANATLVDAFDLPAGEYDTVRLEVGETNGTLTSGESTNVKLPSERLKLNMDFTVENGSEIDFVYDVTVRKAGNSGMYILQPVVGESGTEVPIERVDDDDDDERSIDAQFDGNVTAGENVTVVVTENGSALANATVSVDDGPSGVTDANGEYVVSVPADAEELEIEVEDGDAEAELEYEFDDDASENDDGADNGNGPESVAVLDA